MDCITLFFSDVRLRLEGDVPEVLDALRIVWSLAEHPVIESQRDHRMAVVRRGAGIEVHVDGVVLESCEDPSHALALAERALYHQLHTWHAAELLLHAASFQLDGRACVLLGASGSGKSGLCREAVRGGALYMTDELTVTDGARLWGIPRAIQFDAIPASSVPPEWLGGADVETYRLLDPEGSPCVVPLVPAAETPPAPGPSPAAEACLFELSRGERDQATPLHSIEALAAVHRAALSPVGIDLGALVGAGRCSKLTWATPDGAVSAIRRAIRDC